MHIIDYPKFILVALMVACSYPLYTPGTDQGPSSSSSSSHATTATTTSSSHHGGETSTSDHTTPPDDTDPVIDTDRDGDPDSSDCEPYDNDIHAGAEEIPNGTDDDCDGKIDEVDDPVETTFYLDLDHDGYGRDDVTVQEVTAPSDDWSSKGGDCNDGDVNINPGESEVVGDSVDNDCNVATEDDGDVVLLYTYWHDADGDGYGDALDSIQSSSLTPPVGYAGNDDDCDDSSADAHPGLLEVAGDGVDNDCNAATGDDVVVDEIIEISVTYYDHNDWGTGLWQLWVLDVTSWTGGWPGVFADDYVAQGDVDTLVGKFVGHSGDLVQLSGGLGLDANGENAVAWMTEKDVDPVIWRGEPPIFDGVEYQVLLDGDSLMEVELEDIESGTCAKDPDAIAMYCRLL